MMQIDTDTGWLIGVRRVESPNCDARPADADLDLIVVHGISLPPGKFGGPGVDQLFCNSIDAAEDPYYEKIIDLRVSSHVLITRDGKITQYVPFGSRAWHAGVSCYRDREQCNDFSIGIELEGTDDLAYEDIQYRQLADLVALLRRAYPSLQDAEIVGHSDIAPGRKTDPGDAFDWDLLYGLLES